jgi:hypothetical protein
VAEEVARETAADRIDKIGSSVTETESRSSFRLRLGTADAAMPRLWYLAPQSELTGVLKAAGR